MDIAIIGGTGAFGQHLGKRLQEEHSITITGESEEEAKKVAEEYGWEHSTNTGAAKDKDIVLVCVSMSATIDVINEVGPFVADDTLFCDITSVKKEPCSAMKKHSEEVLGMHPMYGPTNSPKGQKVALCPIKGEKWNVMKEFWEGYGADTHITTPEEHDRAMSIIQGATHFAELVVAETMRRAEMDQDDLEPYSSPVYRLSIDLVGRMLSQKPELYHSIQSMNPENEEIRKKFIESAREVSEKIGDKDEFLELWRSIGEPFELEKAQERTDRIIDMMAEIRE